MLATEGGTATRPRNFLRPCLLLLLRDRPAHGYDLVERLEPFGFTGAAGAEPGAVYRALRALEGSGYVRSAWSPSESGPARRTYSITAAGELLLAEWVVALEASRRSIDAFIDRYDVPGPGGDAHDEPPRPVGDRACV